MFEEHLILMTVKIDIFAAITAHHEQISNVAITLLQRAMIYSVCKQSTFVNH